MKKYVLYLLSFFALFVFFTSNKVEAKTSSLNNISVNFGGDTFQVRTANISSFKIRENKSFYFNGKEHLFNDDYSLIDGAIEVNNNEFILEGHILTLSDDKKLVNSETTFTTYSFPMNVILPSNNVSYDFKQELCYKIEGEERVCNVDIDDISVIYKSATYSYFYDFTPFFDESIVFEEITYNITLTNKSDGQQLIFNPITFNKNEIDYSNCFVVGAYNYNNVLTNNDNIIYVRPLGPDNAGILYTYAYFAPDREYTSDALYSISFEVCVGSNYSECVEVYSKGGSELVPINIGYAYQIPLSVLDNNVIKHLVYDSNSQTTNYDSFMLKGSYVCVENCSENDKNTRVYTNEEIYYLNLKDPSYVGELNGKQAYCGYYTCYGSNVEVSNKIEFNDDNKIKEIAYYISQSSTSVDNLYVNFINNGEILTFGNDLSGLVYLHFRVKDESGSVNNYLFRYFFDKDLPYLSDDNFSDYDRDTFYNEVEVKVTYSDQSSQTSETIYYLIALKDQEVNKEDILDANNVYQNQVTLNKDTISSDGIYKVCFLAQDLVGNYSGVDCSLDYKMDVTSLTKQEVNVEVDNLNYSKEKSITITIDEINNETSFSCIMAPISTLLENVSDLTSTCYTNKESIVSVNGEGSYYLWIYAPDRANNYSLLKLDQEYLFDGIGPRVSYTINGNNSVYSNDVGVIVSINDLSEISETKYSFFLKTYNESEFINFDLGNEITYPFDHYGSYKLAIKVCDNLNNCNIKTLDEEFLIDTSKIKLELIGEEEVTILRWGKYKELGIKATKGNNGKAPINVSYKVDSNIDNGKIGVYYVTYTSGEGMNLVSITRKVIVKDSMPFIVISASLFVVGQAIILFRLFIKKRKNDSI